MNKIYIPAIDEVIYDLGGFYECLKMFKWQGGTIHQVRAEIKNRLNKKGYVIPIRGEHKGKICSLVADNS